MGVMAMAGVSALMQTYSQNKALEAQSKANIQTARNYITSMNYSFQNYEQERQDAYEATIAELEKINLQGTRQTTSVSAAVNEGLMGGGRTADLIKRSAKADVNRAISASKTNYEKKSNEIDLNKETVLLNTKQQISSIKDVEKPSILSTLMNLGTAYYQAKGTLESVDAIRSSAGTKDYKDKNKSNLTYSTIDTSLYGTPQKSFDDVLGGSTFLNDPAVNFQFSNINPYDYYTPQKGRD